MNEAEKAFEAWDKVKEDVVNIPFWELDKIDIAKAAWLAACRWRAKRDAAIAEAVSPYQDGVRLAIADAIEKDAGL